MTAFCCCRGELYAATEDGILALLGSGEAAEARVRWLAETGPWLMELPERKYVACLDVGLSMEADARVRILVAYDLDGQWEPVWTLESRHLRNLSVPIRPRRCDHFRLRLEGEGVVKLYGITRILEKGSDLR